MTAIRKFLARVKASGVKRPGIVKTTAMGRERMFVAYDLEKDTFIFEQGVSRHLNERPSVLIVERSALGRGGSGRVMTMSTGNHSVAAFPLLDGRFWKISHLPAAKRSGVLMTRILCANVVRDTLELSQRELPTAALVGHDAWLLDIVGFGPGDVVMGDRNVMTLDHYRRCGEVWRVKPLAWTEREMKTALAASRKRIASNLTYYHSSRGVHFLAYAEFCQFAALAESSPADFIAALRELVNVYEGNQVSFTRMPKYRGHHEIEFFGLRRGTATAQLVPELEKLMEAITLGRIGQLGVIQRIEEIRATYESLLAQPEFADENSKIFVETLYMHITGEIYSVVGDGSTPAFDDRRTALPGATFVDGRIVLHPGADERTEVLLENLRRLMSKDEVVEYANVYEIRQDEEAGELGKGATREVVYKTNRRPLEGAMIEKRLSHSTDGYSGYMLARIGAMRAIGMSMSSFYQLLKRRTGKGRRPQDYYIRTRCEGEPMDSIPANYFANAGESSGEDREIVLELASLMGDAAAQNLVAKKFDERTKTPLFGVGKEIYEFGYHIARARMVPKRVSTCSIRGTLGWTDLERTDENLQRITGFYMQHYAHALKAYQRCHSVAMPELAARFMSGFEYRIHALAWRLNVMREEFESFNPPMPRRFDFAHRWLFALWALERHEQRLPELRQVFFEKVKAGENENIRNHSK